MVKNDSPFVTVSIERAALDSATLVGSGIFHRNAIQLRQIDIVASARCAAGKFSRELWNTNRSTVFAILLYN